MEDQEKLKINESPPASNGGKADAWLLKDIILRSYEQSNSIYHQTDQQYEVARAMMDHELDQRVLSVEDKEANRIFLKDMFYDKTHKTFYELLLNFDPGETIIAQKEDEESNENTVQ